jgi:hypothetical protein
MGSARHALRFIVTGAAAVAFAVAPTALLTPGATVSHEARPCYNGTIPGDPYAPSCTIPGNQNKIRGSAPDAAAIIACKRYPGCLAWYINNP